MDHEGKAVLARSHKQKRWLFLLASTRIRFKNLSVILRSVQQAPTLREFTRIFSDKRLGFSCFCFSLVIQSVQPTSRTNYRLYHIREMSKITLLKLHSFRRVSVSLNQTMERIICPSKRMFCLLIRTLSTMWIFLILIRILILLLLFLNGTCFYILLK